MLSMSPYYEAASYMDHPYHTTSSFIPKTPLRLQRFCSDAASAIVLGPRGYQTKSK